MQWASGNSALNTSMIFEMRFLSLPARVLSPLTPRVLTFVPRAAGAPAAPPAAAFLFGFFFGVPAMVIGPFVVY